MFVSMQIEAMQVGIYCDIIQNLLVKHRSLSIVKIITFAFIIKKIRFLNINYYSGHNKTDLVLKFISQAQGCYEELCKHITYILQAVDLLLKNDIFELHETEIICKLPANWDVLDYGAFTNAAIAESRNYTNRQFWKEVINIV